MVLASIKLGRGLRTEVPINSMDKEDRYDKSTHLLHSFFTLNFHEYYLWLGGPKLGGRQKYFVVQRVGIEKKIKKP